METKISREETAMVEGEAREASPSPSLARLLRVVYRVKNLDQSVRFYTECFDMKIKGTFECPLKQYAAALMGYGSSSTHFILELRFYFEICEFNVGSGFGHIGINVGNVQKSLESIKSKGGKVTKEARQVKGASTICAFVEDPNGYEIELLQRVSYGGDPLCQVMLRVVDLQSAITFYEKSFGMKMLRKFQLEVSKTKFELAFMGFGPEDRTTVLELNSIYNVAHYDKGNAYLEVF
ncbi:hypothetical protein GOP47_0027184 [Adiantum capillus-veneris]|nr:hypothetical protein GOP47_0027184 [Adiantum capillus-veneris]